MVCCSALKNKRGNKHIVTWLNSKQFLRLGLKKRSGQKDLSSSSHAKEKSDIRIGPSPLNLIHVAEERLPLNVRNVPSATTKVQKITAE